MRPSGFDWNEYLVFARKLLDVISGEASSRISISRAYYAAYWKARQLLESSGVIVPGRNAHSFVWQSFNKCWNSDGESLGKLGSNLKSFRTQADYEAFPHMTKNDAELAVVNAEDLVQCLDAISDTDQALAAKAAFGLALSPEFLSS